MDFSKAIIQMGDRLKGFFVSCSRLRMRDFFLLTVKTIVGCLITLLPILVYGIPLAGVWCAYDYYSGLFLSSSYQAVGAMLATSCWLALVTLAVHPTIEPKQSIYFLTGVPALVPLLFVVVLLSGYSLFFLIVALVSIFFYLDDCDSSFFERVMREPASALRSVFTAFGNGIKLCFFMSIGQMILGSVLLLCIYALMPPVWFVITMPLVGVSIVSNWYIRQRYMHFNAYSR